MYIIRSIALESVVSSKDRQGGNGKSTLERG